MSTLKSVNLQHPSSASPNIVLDSSGNATMAGSMAMATPFAMRNKIINGAMEIDQRNAGASGTGAGNFVVDRWYYYGSQASKVTWQQNSGSVTPPAGFINYLGVVSSSAYSITSTDQFLISQKIEGLNVADLAWGTASAKTVALSFWVYSSLTGTFGGSVQNASALRCYPFSFSISSANTWTYVSIIIPGDTTGTWPTTNGVGLIVNFSLGTGSTYSATANTWTGTQFVTSVTGATSVVGTNGATFYLTGIQLEVGTVATPFERRIYSQELAMCQRYFQTFGGTATYEYIGDAVAASTTSAYAGISLLTSMRAVPSVGLTGPVGDFTLDAGNNNLPITSSIVINSGTSTQKVRLGITYSSATLNATQYYTLLTYAGSTGKLQFSAEL